MLGRVGFAVALIGCGRTNFNPPDALVAGGERANYAFVTSTTHTANLGGLAGADAICQQRAAEGELPGTYVALLSTSTVDAVSRVQGSRGWQRVDGKPVADLFGQLTARRGWYPVSFDELGQDVRDELEDDVWTGSRSDGTAAGTCSDWTSAAASATGGRGSSAAGGARMFDVGPGRCDLRLHLYCFEVGERPVTPPATEDGRLAFVSASSWIPGAGIADADRLCKTEAAAAGKPGTFLAALPPDTSTTAERFVTTGRPWVRGDGVRAAGASSLFTNASLEVPINLGPDGEPLPPNRQVWGGNPLSIGGGLGTCSNWQSATGESPETGNADSTDFDGRFTSGAQGCSAADLHLLCLEE